MLSSRADYYDDHRFCPRCGTYVPYLLSPMGAFCVRCDQRVLLFSQEEHRAFLHSLTGAPRPPAGDDASAA